MPNACRVLAAKKAKNQEKGYKGKSKLSFEEMEQFQKDNKCFKHGEQGHALRVCPKKTQGNGTPKAFVVEVLKEEGNSKGANLFSGMGESKRT